MVASLNSYDGYFTVQCMAKDSVKEAFFASLFSVDFCYPWKFLFSLVSPSFDLDPLKYPISIFTVSGVPPQMFYFSINKFPII